MTDTTIRVQVDITTKHPHPRKNIGRLFRVYLDSGKRKEIYADLRQKAAAYCAATDELADTDKMWQDFKVDVYFWADFTRITHYAWRGSREGLEDFIDKEFRVYFNRLYKLKLIPNMAKRIKQNSLNDTERYFLKKATKEGWKEQYSAKLLTKQQEEENHG